MTVGCELLLVGDQPDRLQAAAEAVEQQTRQLERKFNFHAADSWLNRHINRRPLSHVSLDRETAGILARVRELSLATRGAFDITLGTVKAAAKADPTRARAELLAQYQPAIGLESWQLDEQMLRLPHPETQLDLGGVIKEYAVDQALLLCRRQGIRGGLINFGGDIASWGHKPDGQPFRVAIKHPRHPEQVLCTLALKNQALATSGHYERQLVCAGQAGSHILHPDDIHHDLLSVSVVSDSVLTSGIYSTALTINPSLAKDAAIAPLFVDSQLRLHQDYDSLRAARHS